MHPIRTDADDFTWLQMDKHSRHKEWLLHWQSIAYHAYGVYKTILNTITLLYTSFKESPIPFPFICSYHTTLASDNIPISILTESSRLYQELCCTVVRNPWTGRKWLWKRKQLHSLWELFQYFKQTHNSSISGTYSSQPAFNTHK